MSSYEIEYSEKAEADVKRLDKKSRANVLSKIEFLAANADTLSHKALIGNWKGYFSLRSGSYRIIYRLDREIKLIFIQRIRHRREVYEE